MLFVGYDRLPMSALKAAVTWRRSSSPARCYANHENGSTYVLYYFWATVYAFAFFSLAQAAFQTALVGVCLRAGARTCRATSGSRGGRALAAGHVDDDRRRPAGPLPTGTLRHRSLHDPLTGLPNRRLYLDALDEALERSGRPGRRGTVAVLFLDLDGFKFVNDSLGHTSATRCLRGRRRAPRGRAAARAT